MLTKHIDLLIKDDIFINDTVEKIPLIQAEEAQISISREVLTSCRGKREVNVRVASLLYRNMSGLLPERLEEDIGRFVDSQILELKNI